VYFNDSPAPVIDITDGTYSSGYFGLNVYKGGAFFSDVNRHIK
jgi:levanase